MRYKDWKRKAWILAVAFVLLCVVNPELRALVFLIDVLSLEVFLLFVGLQVKDIWLLIQPVGTRLLAVFARRSGVVLRHFGVGVNALNPRISLALLTQQTLWAARMPFRAGLRRACSGKAA